MMLAVPVDQLDEIGRESGKIGQRLMNDHRSRRERSGGGASRRAFGRDTLALYQQDGLVVFASQDGVIAFDEHDAGSIGAETAGCNIIIPLLETTLHTHNEPADTGFSFTNSVPMGEDQSDRRWVRPTV